MPASIPATFDLGLLWVWLLGVVAAAGPRLRPDRRQPPGSIGVSLEFAWSRVSQVVVVVIVAGAVWAAAGLWAKSA